MTAPTVRPAVAGSVWRPDPTMVGVFTSVWSGYALANNESYATLIDGDPRAIAARVRAVLDTFALEEIRHHDSAATMIAAAITGAACLNLTTEATTDGK